MKGGGKNRPYQGHSDAAKTGEGERTLTNQRKKKSHSAERKGKRAQKKKSEPSLGLWRRQIKKKEKGKIKFLTKEREQPKNQRTARATGRVSTISGTKKKQAGKHFYDLV